MTQQLFERKDNQTDPPQSDKAPGLTTVRALFDALNRAAIRYCHWKSNVRLIDAINGRTDLDLLVDPTQERQFRRILARHHVVRVLAPVGKRYPRLEDYLGYDAESGLQFHLHVHYRLILGEQFVKNYELPLERPFLDSVRLCHGVKIPSPELELVVLSMRALLKYRDRDVIKDVLTIRYPGVPKHISDEIQWLMGQTSPRQIRETLTTLDAALPGEVVLAFLDTMATSPRDGKRLFLLRQRLRSFLRRYQRYGRVRATAIYFVELWRRRNTFLKFKPTPQMTLPDRGLTIALVGVDGAGKTTQTRAVREWLSWKLDVHPFYLGSKEPSWFSRNAYLVFRMARRSHTELSARFGEQNSLCRAVALLRDTLLYTHYCFTGLDRRRRIRAGERLASAGSLVVYDRFPLEAPLDGPQIHLAPNGSTRLSGKVLSGWEKKLYDSMKLPDMLFTLELPPKLSMARKPDHSWSAIVEKNTVLNRLISTMEEGGANLIRIDTTNSRRVVLNHLKQHIWSRLEEKDDR